jgi:hypothetical protein
MCLGNRREKVGKGGDREYIDVWGRDLKMEGTRRGRESARKIFERGARSGERSARLHSEGRV